MGARARFTAARPRHSCLGVEAGTGAAVTEAERIEFVTNAHTEHRGLVHSVVARCIRRIPREDVVQNVWMKVFRYAHTYDAERGSIATWLALIARREAQNHLREQLRSIPEMPLLEHTAPQADEPGGDTEGFERLLEELPAHEAETLSLLARGLTFDEVARLTNEPKATIYGRFARSRRRALHRLQQE
jgi:RNA polymerase sigma factor (sigma-70 family)